MSKNFNKWSSSDKLDYINGELFDEVQKELPELDRDFSGAFYVPYSTALGIYATPCWDTLIYDNEILPLDIIEFDKSDEVSLSHEIPFELTGELSVDAQNYIKTIKSYITFMLLIRESNVKG